MKFFKIPFHFLHCLSLLPVIFCEFISAVLDDTLQKLRLVPGFMKRFWRWISTTAALGKKEWCLLSFH